MRDDLILLKSGRWMKRRKNLLSVCNRDKRMWNGYLTVEANYLLPNILWQAILHSSLIPGTPRRVIVLIHFCPVRSQTEKASFSRGTCEQHFWDFIHYLFLMWTSTAWLPDGRYHVQTQNCVSAVLNSPRYVKVKLNVSLWEICSLFITWSSCFLKQRYNKATREEMWSTASVLCKETL